MYGNGENWFILQCVRNLFTSLMPSLVPKFFLLAWPLEERNENEPYVWFNTRNKGQITITKKWVDNLTNEERQEPKIYISTLNNEEAYSKVYFRQADSTHSILDYVTAENVTAFKRNITLTEAQVTAKANVVRIDNNYAETNAKYKIYAWNDNGTVFWWTKADRAVLPIDSQIKYSNYSQIKSSRKLA